jgi:hypothetical protein
MSSLDQVLLNGYEVGTVIPAPQTLKYIFARKFL